MYHYMKWVTSYWWRYIVWTLQVWDLKKTYLWIVPSCFLFIFIHSLRIIVMIGSVVHFLLFSNFAVSTLDLYTFVNVFSTAIFVIGAPWLTIFLILIHDMIATSPLFTQVTSIWLKIAGFFPNAPGSSVALVQPKSLAKSSQISSQISTSAFSWES